MRGIYMQFMDNNYFKILASNSNENYNNFVISKI